MQQPTPTFDPRLIAELRAMSQRKGMPPEGICSIIHNNFTVSARWLDDAFRRWPEFSGDVDFPVSHPTLHPKNAFSLGSTEHPSVSLWDADTEYGRARRRLCVFLADEMEKANAEVRL